MKGQWVGELASNDGNGKFCVINVETQQDDLLFYCYLLERNFNIPSSYARFNLKKDKKEYFIKLSRNDMTILDRNFTIVHSGLVEHTLEKEYPNAEFSFDADATFRFEEDKLFISIESNLGVSFSGYLSNKIEDNFTFPATTITWDEFKKRANAVNYREVAFRGQSDLWPLRTSFHRTGRMDVINYAINDIPHVHRRLSGLIQHYLNLSDPQHYGAFYNLLQHHGYPTPLLDWSYSPYVAAFFAFYQITSKEIEKGEIGRKARIYLWEVDLWKKSVLQFSNIFDCRLHLSIGEYISLNNQRAIPQQALTSLTNIYDIEGYLYNYGEKTDRYLKAFDISIEETPTIMRELALMGITYGTLFPGLDGACYDLKKINFPNN